MAINTWVVSLMAYGAGVMKWTKRELDETDLQARKVTTVNKEQHPRNDADKLYDEGRKRIDNLQDVCESRGKQPWMEGHF